MTPEQKNCIEFISHTPLKKHLVIEAGAGAGKTFVLIQRLIWLMTTAKPPHRLKPHEICVLTFSRDADAEIKERLKAQLAKLKLSFEARMQIEQGVHISTIDSYFANIVEEIYPQWWIKNHSTPMLSNPPQLRHVENEEVIFKLEKTLFRMLKEKAKTISFLELSQLMDFILAGYLKTSVPFGDSQKDILVKALISEAFITAEPGQLLIKSKQFHPATVLFLQDLHALARSEFHERIKNGEFTYADKTVFLKEHARKFVPIFKELIVDEYQDTNSIQHEILFQIVEQRKDARMIVVGDPKQSIYGFRDSSVEIYNQLKHDTQWNFLELNFNFRSEPYMIEEINLLSALTFKWQDGNVPEPFFTSSFYKKIALKHVDAKDLKCPQEKSSQTVNVPMDVVAVSLSKERMKNEEKLEHVKAIRLNYAALYALYDYIRCEREKKFFKWSDIVILCERNHDLEKIYEFFQERNIPTSFSLKNKSKWNRSTNASLSHENKTSLSLIAILLGEWDELGLLELFLNFDNHTSLEKLHLLVKEARTFLQNDDNDFKHFFSSQNNLKIIEKHDNEYNSSILQLPLGFLQWVKTIRKSKEIGSLDIWQGWLDLKLSFETWIEHEELIGLKKKQSLRESLSHFSYFFYHNLLHEESFANKGSQACAASLLKASDPDRDYSYLLKILSKAYAKYLFHSHDIYQQKDTADAIDLCTVHGAKGREWRWVIFWPKYSHSSQQPAITWYRDENKLNVAWIQIDNEKMSALTPLENPHFTEIDHVLISDKKDKKNEKVWFYKLEKHMENLFERQRVFYTAFTRAKEKLTLMQPIQHPSTRAGLRDTLYKIKKDDDIQKKLSFERFENAIFMNYLDLKFDLKKAGHKGEKPQEPWYEFNNDGFLSNDGMVKYYDYGPDKIFELIENSSHRSLVSLLQNREVGDES